MNHDTVARTSARLLVAVCTLFFAARGVCDPLLERLDAPLLFVKRHSYTGIHIYDTFYKWPPGGGGIYVLENPRDPREQWRIRPVIDPSTPGTLGLGVYTTPELSWDATRLLFCFKGEPNGCTSIYEIGVDGTGLRRLTDPSVTLSCYKGSLGGQHDVEPAYLPDGRIVFCSTRPSGLVPCNNTGVAILHVMNADGSNIRHISVNNVNEFDPAVLPDGRIAFGRWEYIDKNALTIQSLWTIHPDGTNETALFANNMVFPEALLDVRPVPHSHLLAVTLAKHNSTPRGTVGMIDPHRGKNDPAAIHNFEHPQNPTHDTGDSCEPFPLDEDTMLFSARPRGHARNIIQVIHRDGRRATVLSDPDISLHAPMLVKPRPVPPALHDTTNPSETTGAFFVQNVYQGLDGIPRGEARWLRVIEETSRISASPGSPNPYNQTFLVSAALAFSAKNYLGITPVHEDGMAYFRAPSGRALYFQLLDADRRLIQSMRTFFQAAPGTVRSCIGCHEQKYSSPSAAASALAARPAREPAALQPESWGTGYLDYPSMIQPIWDQHCIGCHGGEKGFAGRLDLSGGWTEHFNISYENLVDRRETQLIAHLIAGIDCMNGTAHWSSQIFAPRAHGSGAAPLAEAIMSGHKGRIPKLTELQRDLVMAWIDSNGLYHGTWDTTAHGYWIGAWGPMRDRLLAQMGGAGCTRCHDGVFTSDWVNLRDPEFSRILRAPLAPGAGGYGQAICRDHPMDPKRRRIRLLRDGYAHAVQPVSHFAPQPMPTLQAEGQPEPTFTSAEDPRYRAMLAIIEQARMDALSAPRVDMPGAEPIAGESRMFIPTPLPARTPPLHAVADDDGVVHLSWERSAATIGLTSELHRSTTSGFTPEAGTVLLTTSLFRYSDRSASDGAQHYALILAHESGRSSPSHTTVVVPPPRPPAAPRGLHAAPAVGGVRLAWTPGREPGVRYHVHRKGPGERDFATITAAPIASPVFVDSRLPPEEPHTYRVVAVSRRGVASEPSPPAAAHALPEIKEPVFAAAFHDDGAARLHTGEEARGVLHGKAAVNAQALDLRTGGHVTFDHRPEFSLEGKITVATRVKLTGDSQMPVLVSCGEWNRAGWFLQRIGGGWRWHVGGIDCDGGTPAPGRWTELVATFDGDTARLFQDGALVAERSGVAVRTPWVGPLHVGQYSGGPGAPYQVVGLMADVRVYARAIPADEIQTHARRTAGQGD